jgi:pimeloyl-ACP methyl ester carboxylesterase/DNA-binding winged helix-turn-helix (wHTH) protein
LVFGDCELDTERVELRRAGRPVHVERQVFEVLAYLITHRDRVVMKSELLDRVWGDRFVSESTLTSRVKEARRAIGDDGASQRFIRTVHGRGYQFIADTDDASGAAPVPRPLPPEERQQIGFCTAPDGVRLAYAISGSGPPLVKAANWFSHLDEDWLSPVWRPWLQALGRERTLVRYDERGCGMSDWAVERFEFDAWVEDLELVVDSVGLDSFPLVGLSQGGAVAIAYAVRHPDRVTKLVLVGAYARGRMLRALSDEERREVAIDLELARIGWRRDDEAFRQVFSSQFLPDGPPELWHAFNDLQRRTTSPDNAARFLETFSTIDVSGIAPRVQCPTLILHGRHDLRQPLECARELASLVPGSRLVPLDTRNHILSEHEPAWSVMLQELGDFLGAG